MEQKVHVPMIFHHLKTTYVSMVHRSIFDQTLQVSHLHDLLLRVREMDKAYITMPMELSTMVNGKKTRMMVLR